MGLDVLKGELGKMPEAARRELTSLRDAIAAETEKVGDDDTRDALKEIKAAIEAQGSTRKGVAREISTRMAALKGSPELAARLARMGGVLETDRSLGFESHMDALSTSAAVTGEALQYAGKKGVELGSQGIEKGKEYMGEINKLPLYMRIPVITSILGAGAYGLSKVLGFFRIKSPRLEGFAKVALAGGLLAGVGVGFMGARKTTAAETPTTEATATEATPAEPAAEPATVDIDAPKEGGDKK